ncbi:MAG: MBL fold metallo-hydrolase [Bacteroidetes bacterium HGW-Bacteroidetes-17]|jgi:glyoxylase-like metal-dependent hydrolase (beta-lactamase superfamily II)|nr:MAG: MBL fold metallo-hydrolase [Bacteroidetes bacterium HGW-Bacteroidetes-17]
MKLYAIETGNLKLDGGAMFGVVPKVMWNKFYPADENNLCNWAMRCLLIDDGEHVILIDNGIGDKQDENFLKHYYLNGEATLETSLNKYGYTTDDVTDMLLTHLHFDHCGGSIKYDKNGKLVPAFKNAKYWVSQEQYDWATNPNRREKASFLKENILPIKESGQLNIVEKEGEIIPNIYAKIFNGHTQGQIIPHIKFGGKTIAYTADLFPSTAHIPMPWIMAYDTKPLITLEDRERFFKEAVEENVILFFEHDLYHECCTIEMTEKGVKVKETFRLNELVAG